MCCWTLVVDQQQILQPSQKLSQNCMLLHQRHSLRALWEYACILFRHLKFGAQDTSIQCVYGPDTTVSCARLVQAMVGEPLAAVRCVALRCLGRVLEGVDSLPPSDAKIFNEYALAPAPRLSKCTNLVP